jgi:hypothetical protein
MTTIQSFQPDLFTGRATTSIPIVVPPGRKGLQPALALAYSSSSRNGIDRGRFGAVVDFVDVYWRGYHWPAFNVADSAITVGVALLALRLLEDRPSEALTSAPVVGRIHPLQEAVFRSGVLDVVGRHAYLATPSIWSA